jgi:hypothetical protein
VSDAPPPSSPSTGGRLRGAARITMRGIAGREGESPGIEQTSTGERETFSSVRRTHGGPPNAVL